MSSQSVVAPKLGSRSIGQRVLQKTALDGAVDGRWHHMAVREFQAFVRLLSVVRRLSTCANATSSQNRVAPFQSYSQFSLEINIISLNPPTSKHFSE